MLPSHKLPFIGLHQRIAQLRAHHEERLDATLAACRQLPTAWEATGVLFPRALDLHQLGFALGETLAHLNRLVAAGLVRRLAEPGRPDRYAPA